ncbi:hypothetical protein HMPREF1141_1101 [Clostridium sp. MSTE9]|uniref:hypothetical protein n=1 Tax=Clostridium sp. (strain MSTE9) TaxID=1105031 RepID=UPI00026F1ADF|nr:hypothetical protein [Clostridium sp. MSTE9]EJF40940.1 hypothetical protein HMPREF1141_1101 [Clostridium sp. MSTE9]
MGNLLAATTVSEAFGTALTQVQTDAMEFIAQGLPIGLAIMGTILAITIGVKAFKRFAK